MGEDDDDDAQDILLRQTAIELYVELLVSKPPSKLPKILLETISKNILSILSNNQPNHSSDHSSYRAFLLLFRTVVGNRISNRFVFFWNIMTVPVVDDYNESPKTTRLLHVLLFLEKIKSIVSSTLVESSIYG